jgi:hypothetical protein
MVGDVMRRAPRGILKADVGGERRAGQVDLQPLGTRRAEWLGAFDEFSVVGEKFHHAGNRVVVQQIFRGTGKGSRIPIDEIPGAAVLTLSDGKVTRFEGHMTMEAALRSAGIED